MVRGSISIPIEENQSSRCGRISSTLPFSFILEPHDSIIAVRKFRHSATFNQSSLISTPASPTLTVFFSLRTLSKIRCATFFTACTGYILRVFSLSEQVSQCSTITPSGVTSYLQLDGDFVSPYPRPQSHICVLVSIYMVTVR